MKPTLIIDADDTLWENEIYFRQAVAAFAELMVSQGFELEEAERSVDRVERERIPIMGYSPEEFCRSLVIAYQRLCESHDVPPDDEVSNAVWEIGQIVAEYPIVLLDGVAEALERLSAHCHLVLLTKGDQDVQASKLARSGLGHFFNEVHVVREKNTEVIQTILSHHGLLAHQTWMVGNSPRSDINPALQAGIGAIYIPHPTSWDLEQEEIAFPERVIRLKSFGELVDLFLSAGGLRT